MSNYERQVQRIVEVVRAKGIAHPSVIRAETGITSGYLSDLINVALYRRLIKATPKGYVPVITEAFSSEVQT